MPDDIRTPGRPELRTRFTRPANEERSPNATRDIKRRRLDADDPEMASAQTSPDVEDLLTPEEKADIREHAPLVKAALMKAILARGEPRKYVLADEEDDAEVVAMRAIQTIDEKVVERIIPRVDTLMRNEQRAERIVARSIAGKLREPLRIKVVRPKVKIRHRGNDRDSNRAGAAPAPDKPVYTRALAELRAVHCIRITEPRDNPDEMVLATVLVDADANVKAGLSEDLGTFYSGDLFSFEELPIGQFNLNVTNGYPKHQYVLFKLVETDADGRETARDLTKAIGGLAKGIAGVYAGAVGVLAAGMLIDGLSAFFQGIIDEDEFPIVGKRLTLEHMHSLGSSVGPRERTGDIGGHGGKYRIGYRWLMGA